MKKIYKYYLYLFYRVSWKKIDNEDRLYVVKRKWAWWLFFVLIYAYRMVVNFFVEFINTFNDVYSYDCRWFTFKKEFDKKLSVSQEIEIIHRLRN